MGPFSQDPDGEDDSFCSGSGSDRKTRKPIVERRRRARINESLQELRTLLPDSELSSKMENAEVLEMTVKHVEQILQNRSEEAPVDGAGERFAAGYIQCMHEVHTFVSAPSGLHATTATHLLSHLLECMPLHTQEHTDDSSSQHTHSEEHTHSDTHVDDLNTEHAEEQHDNTQELEDTHTHSLGQDTQSHTLQETLPTDTPHEQETHLYTPGNKPHPYTPGNMPHPNTAAHWYTPEQQAHLSSPVPQLHTVPTETHLSSPENKPRPSTPGQAAHWSTTKTEAQTLYTALTERGLPGPLSSPEPQASYTAPMETQLSIPGNKPHPYTPGQGAHLSIPEAQTSYTALTAPQPHTPELRGPLPSSTEPHLYSAPMETQLSIPGGKPHPYTPGQGAHLSIPGLGAHLSIPGLGGALPSPDNKPHGAHLSIPEVQPPLSSSTDNRPQVAHLSMPELRGPLSSSSPVPRLYPTPMEQDFSPVQQVHLHTPENGSHLYTAGHIPTQTRRHTHTPDGGGSSHLYNAEACYPQTPQSSRLAPQPHSAAAAPMTTVSRQLYAPQEQEQEVDMMEEAGPQPGQSATGPHHHDDESMWRPW